MQDNNVYDDILLSDRKQEVQSTIASVAGTNPDVEARLQGLAKQYNMPVEAVRFREPEITRQAKVDSFSYDDLAKNYPKTSAALSNPEIAAVSHDQGGVFTSLESAAKYLVSAPGAPREGLAVDAAKAAEYLRISTHSGILNLGAVGLTLANDALFTSEADLAKLYKNDPAGLQKALDNDSVRNAARSLQKRSEGVMAGLSPQTKAQYAGLTYSTLEEGKSAWRNPVKILGDAMQSAPTSLALGISALLTKNAASAAYVEAIAQGVSTSAARVAAELAGASTMARVGAVSEGVVGYAQQKNQTREEVDKVKGADVEKSEAYQKLIAEGYDPKSARILVSANAADQAGMLAGIADAAVNFVGGKLLGKIIGSGGKTPVVAAKGAVNEGLTEAVQSPAEQFGQNVAVQRNVNPGQDLEDGVLESALQGFAVGALTGGAMGGIAAKAQRNLEASTVASQHAEALTTMQTVAEASALVKRSPATLSAYAQSLVDEGVPQVFVDANALVKAGVDLTELAQALPVVANQLQNVQHGGDLLIPTGEFLTQSIGTNFAQALMDNARTSADGMSKAEATVYMQEHGEAISKEVEQALGEKANDESFKASRDELQQRIETELNAVKRNTPAVNQQNAALLANFYAVTAARVGVSPSDFANTYKLNFTSEVATNKNANTLEQGKGLTIDAVHYSTQARSVLTSGLYGTNYAGNNATMFKNAEDKRLRNRLYFYADKGTGINPEAGVGGVAHTTTLTNIYDANSDPLRLRKGSQLDFESKVLDRGFSGYVDRLSGSQSAQVILLGEHAIAAKVLPAGEKPSARPVADPAVRQSFGRDAVVDSVTNNKALPTGAPTLSRWAEILQLQDPAAYAAMDAAGVFKGEGNLYKSELLAKFEAATEAPNYEGVEGREADGSLLGLPRVQGAHHSSAIESVAKAYMESMGLEYKRPNKYAEVDVERAGRIAREFAQMEHNPQDPEVKAAYAAMVFEVAKQYEAAVAAGLQVEFIDFAKTGDPYQGNPRGMTDDVNNNNHMWVFSTREGFGTDASFDASDNPLLAETPFKISGQVALANDLFRVVHDYFGHAKEGVGFRASGEENAWRAHSSMFSPLAARAMTTETRGQNSWLNYGPYGATNRTAKVEDTHFADQKIGLLPEWASTEGAGDATNTYDQSRVKTPTRAITALLKNLTPEEQGKVTDKLAARILAVIEDLPSSKEMAATAWAGRAKRGWYKQSGDAIAAVFGADAPRFAGLLAALSPQVSVETNLLNALNTWKNWVQAGRPQTREEIVSVMGRSVQGRNGTNSVLDAWINNSVRSLTSDGISSTMLSGPKVHSFFKNLTGHVAEVTNDAWMANYALVNQTIFKGGLNEKGTDSGKGAGYLAMNAQIRGAAAQLTKLTGETWSASEVQETVWSWAKTLYEASEREGESRTARQLVEDGALDDKLIASTPDFGSLFHDDKYADILKEAGYEEQLKDNRGDRERAARFAAEEPGAREQTTPFDRETQRRLELQAARRLERLAENRGDAAAAGRSAREDNAVAAAYDQSARGQIAFADDITKNASLMSLLKGADLSTFIHESGHFFLEVNADLAGRIVRNEDASANELKLVEDFNTALRWFGVKGTEDLSALDQWFSMSAEEKRPYHEQWARGFEAYAFEGKAPSADLQHVFQTFRAWLVNVYRALLKSVNAGKTDIAQALDVSLNDEVRAVMDRMLATSDQITEAEAARDMGALFQTAESAGMTPAEYAAYHELATQATMDATDNLQARSLRDMQWLRNARSRKLKELQSQHDELRKQTTREVRAEVMAEPVYRAWSFLTSRADPVVPGVTDVGAIDLSAVSGRLRTEVLREMYGTADDAPWRTLVARRMTSDEKGMHPEIVAELFGFDSADALVQALVSADSPTDVVEGLTDTRMLQEHGDLSSPAGLERAADAATHNEMRARVVATELNAIDKAMRVRAGQPGKRNTVDVLANAAKSYAREVIARLKVKDIHPKQYVAAAVRAGKSAEKAKGDLQQAAQHKRNQLINIHAAKEAFAAQDEVTSAVAYFKKFDKPSKSIDAEYDDQIGQLLERFDLRASTTLKEIKERTSLLEWLRGQEEQGFAPDIPENLLYEAGRKSFKDMTVEEVRGLRDSVQQIEHLGRLKHKLLTAKDQREFNAVRDDIVAGLQLNSRGRIADTRTANTVMGEKLQALKGFWASHIKVATWARVMDGGQDGGPVWEYIVRAANEAGDKEVVMREKATKALAALVAPVRAEGALGGKGIYFPSISRSLNREAKLAIALNVGNESNLQRLLGGERWSVDQIQPVLDSLSATEWTFVQAVWDHFESYRPLIAAKERRVYGREPNWLEATPVQTQYGELRGGYFPVKYDPRASERAEAHADAEGAKRQLQGAYTTATTRRSFTKARADEVHGRPLLLSLDGVYGGVQEVIHDLSWHEFLIDANRLIKNKSIASTMRGTYGAEAHQQFKRWLEDVAEGDRGSQAAGEKALAYLRHGVSVAGLGLNVMSALVQPLGLTQSITRIGAKWVGRGIVKALGSPLQTVDDINSKSEFMRTRAMTRLREINEVRAQVKGQTKTRAAIDASAYFLMLRAQQLVDVPTWWGAYEKAIAGGNDEVRATSLADQAVIDSQGSGGIKDQSAIERGGPAIKLFTTFYSFFNTALNMGVQKTMTHESKAKLAADFLLLYTAPVILASALKDALTPGDSGGWDDDAKLAKKLAGEQISYLFGLMFGVREVTGAIQAATGTSMYGADYGGPAGVRMLGDLTKLGKQLNQGEMDDGLRKAIINVAGELARLPAAQVNRTITGINALNDGKTSNPAAVVFGYQEP